MSRGAWLALGTSMAFAACSDAAKELAGNPDANSPAEDAAAVVEAGGSEQEAAAVDVRAAEDTSTADARVAMDARVPIDARVAMDARVDDGALEANAVDAHQKTDAVSGGDGVTDASPDAGVCTSRRGHFACGYPDASASCDRSTQYCVVDVSGQCVDYPTPFAADGSVVLCPTCATVYSASCDCVEDDAGGISITSCSGCYGAPPARLERLVS